MPPPTEAPVRPAAPEAPRPASVSSEPPVESSRDTARREAIVREAATAPAAEVVRDLAGRAEHPPYTAPEAALPGVSGAESRPTVEAEAVAIQPEKAQKAYAEITSNGIGIGESTTVDQLMDQLKEEGWQDNAETRRYVEQGLLHAQQQRQEAVRQIGELGVDLKGRSTEDVLTELVVHHGWQNDEATQQFVAGAVDRANQPPPEPIAEVAAVSTEASSATTSPVEEPAPDTSSAAPESSAARTTAPETSETARVRPLAPEKLPPGINREAFQHVYDQMAPELAESGLTPRQIQEKVLAAYYRGEAGRVLDENNGEIPKKIFKNQEFKDTLKAWKEHMTRQVQALKERAGDTTPVQPEDIDERELTINALADYLRNKDKNYEPSWKKILKTLGVFIGVLVVDSVKQTPNFMFDQRR